MLICKTQESDIPEIILMENDCENSQYIQPNTEEEHYGLIKDDNIEHLLLKSEYNTTLGFAILAGLKDKNRNIEFRRIVIKDKGKGFGRKAVKKLKEYSFGKLGCHRLWLDVLENNERARSLYLSEGFKEDGKLRERILINNNYQSLLIMSILENEYRNANLD